MDDKMLEAALKSIRDRIDEEGFDVVPCAPEGALCIGKKRRDRKKAGYYHQKCGEPVDTVLSLEIPGTGSVDLPLCQDCMRKLTKNLIDYLS